MLLKILERLDRRRIIYDREKHEPYLIRYYLFLKDRKWFPFNVFLHNFRKSDIDDLHDHPWHWMTIVLKGGYWEYTPKGKFWRGPGFIGLRKPQDLHRVELVEGIYPWTLFFVGPKRKEWGFVDNGKWIQNETYLKEKYNVL